MSIAWMRDGVVVGIVYSSSCSEDEEGEGDVMAL